MATYATITQYGSYVEDNPEADASDDAAIERLLDRAGRDIERYLGWPAPLVEGPRIDVLELTAFEAAALARGVCAQAEFRAMVGEDEIVGDTDYLPTGLQIMRTAPRVAVKAQEELAGAGLMRHTLTVAPDVDDLIA